MKPGPKKGQLQRRTRRRLAYLQRLLEDKQLADARWAQEVLTLALADHRQFFDRLGNLKPVHQWTPEMGAIAASTETIIKNAEGGDGHTDRILKLRSWDKLRALELWGKYRSLLVEQHKHEHSFTLEDAVAQSRRDDPDRSQ